MKGHVCLACLIMQFEVFSDYALKLCHPFPEDIVLSANVKHGQESLPSLHR